jgi:hypothetical protein
MRSAVPRPRIKTHVRCRSSYTFTNLCLKPSESDEKKSNPGSNLTFTSSSVLLFPAAVVAAPPLGPSPASDRAVSPSPTPPTAASCRHHDCQLLETDDDEEEKGETEAYSRRSGSSGAAATQSTAATNAADVLENRDKAGDARSKGGVIFVLAIVAGAVVAMAVALAVAVSVAVALAVAVGRGGGGRGSRHRCCEVARRGDGAHPCIVGCAS